MTTKLIISGLTSMLLLSGFAVHKDAEAPSYETETLSSVDATADVPVVNHPDFLIHAVDEASQPLSGEILGIQINNIELGDYYTDSSGCVYLDGETLDEMLGTPEESMVMFITDGITGTYYNADLTMGDQYLYDIFVVVSSELLKKE